VVTSLVALALQGIDPSLEEAARVVAPPARVIGSVLLPATRPALVLAAIVVFTLAFSELGVAMFLRVDVFPAAVFARLGGIDYAPGEAVALVLPLLPLAFVLLAVERRFVGSRSFAVLGLRGAQRQPIRLGRWRTAAFAMVWLVVAVSIAPLFALANKASAAGMRGVGAWLGRSPWNSLWAAAAAATIIVLVGLVVGHAAARGYRWSVSLDALAVLAFVTPAAVLGVGLIGVWNRPVLPFVYGSLGIIAVGYVARYAVLGVRTVAAVVAQSPVYLEDAAAVAGAGFLRRLTRIVVPVHARGLGFGWLLALVFCLRDLETSVLYYPPGREPLTIRLFTLEANGPEAVVAGLAVVQVAMTAAVLAAGGWLLARSPSV
jgi:iron(III) transport system permease protein